ncbi:DNA mismatch repair ATPase msh1 [Ascosphaera aggregata]|nr:DNA mismatch repair ATPase msh1 [Ascosphaera aggregata]
MLCSITFTRRLLLASVKPLYGPAAQQLLRKPLIWSPFLLQQQQRGAKKTTRRKLKDLPQGVLQAKVPYEEVTDVPQYPAVLQGARNNMLKFKDCVLLTRVGSFYEMYFEQAEEYAQVLGLRLGYKKTAVCPVPMAGFPYFHLDRYLKLFVQDLQKKVAISEEFSNDVEAKAKAGGLMFNRKVTRIITPGTLIDENFMNPYENNFLLAVQIESSPMVMDTPEDQTHASLADRHVGLAWLDLSTGQFYTQSTTLGSLPSISARISAREVIIDATISNQPSLGEWTTLLGVDERLVTPFRNREIGNDLSQWNESLETPLTPEQLSAFAPLEIQACNTLLGYVKEQMLGLKINLQPPMRQKFSESMIVDRNSIRGLEILKTSRDQIGKGSLLNAVRRTSTKSGARLLQDRLTSPSASLQVINERLDLVSQFVEDEHLRDIVIDHLKRNYDTQRLVQKFSLGRGDADDLISIAKSIRASKLIHSILADYIRSAPASNREALAVLQRLVDRFNLEGPELLSNNILEAIDEEWLSRKHRIEDDIAARAATLAQEVAISEGDAADLDALPKKTRSIKINKEDLNPYDAEAWVMRRSATPAIAMLHADLDRLREEKEELTASLREEMGVSSLNLKWTPRNGYIAHVKGSKAIEKRLNAINARTISASRSSRSLQITSWTHLGARFDEMKCRIRAEELRIFENLREQVICNLVKLRANAAILDELDVACSFATLAWEQQMVRPIVNYSKDYKVVGGRHPTVKLGLEEAGRSFVTNDCFLDGKERAWLITGPNMAGKSTFLRQNALIVILAQVGSFVPADYAEIGIADQMFSRIGAADDLFRDQSTFMVEMLETAAIMKNATARSFVIMDEVGRGTTPEDGTAVAFSCLTYLHDVNKCRTLFATHFHAIADMTVNFPHLGRYCTDIREGASGSFSFDHKLRSGVNRTSHALKVARLAGLPEKALEVARAAREELSVGSWVKFRGAPEEIARKKSSCSTSPDD